MVNVLLLIWGVGGVQMITILHYQVHPFLDYTIQPKRNSHTLIIDLRLNSEYTQTLHCVLNDMMIPMNWMDKKTKP